MAHEENTFSGVSTSGALSLALRISQQVKNAGIAFIGCDRGDRYLSTAVFPAGHFFPKGTSALIA